MSIKDTEEVEEHVLIECFERCRENLGANNADTLLAMFKLGSFYFEQGKLEFSREIFTELLEKSKRKHGIDHFNTMNAMRALANVYYDQGEHKAARRLVRTFQKDIDAIEAKHLEFLQKCKSRGDSDSSMKTTMLKLAECYCAQGKYVAAKNIYTDLLELTKISFGPESPDSEFEIFATRFLELNIMFCQKNIAELM